MNPEATYTTDKGPIYIIMVAAFLFLILAIYVAMHRLFVIAGFFMFLFISCCRFIYTSQSDYTEVKVYTDYLTIGGKEGVLRTIAFQEIKNAGFLESAQFVNRMDRNVRYRNEQLILLLRGNGKVELPPDLENAHELCQIIQSRIS